MQLAPIPVDEIERLEDLSQLTILDTDPEERFDRIARIIQLTFQVAQVFVTLIDKDRVWMKSKLGSDISEEPRDISICGHTICNIVTDDLHSRIMEVPNILEDNRFFDNPIVSETPPITYYAGFALQSSGGRNIGTVCMMDTGPRVLTLEQRSLFAQLGLLLEAEIQKQSRVECSEEQCGDFLLYAKDSVDNSLREFSVGLKRIGISVNEWRVLHEIVARRVCFPNRIAENLSLARSSITRLMDLLESKGLIERRYGEALDRRQVSVSCNDTGFDSWKHGFDHANKLGRKFCNALGSFDWNG